jgi:hypothetical protein
MRVSARVVLLLAGIASASSISIAALKAQGGAAPVRPSSIGPQAPPVITAAREQQLFQQFCYGCHNERVKATGLDSAQKLTLDTLDTANVHRDARTWELVARKLRAGMMPPVDMRRPDPATLEAMIAWLENELDRDASPYTPPPGLHRLNRTEYANSIRDLLDLPIDPAKYLPSDDSTSGFDNIAGALGISSTLVEAYVTAAQKISRLAVGEMEDPTLVVYRTREDTSQDYHVEGLPFGTRGGLLVEHLFPSDGEYTITATPIFGDNMTPIGFGSVPCEQLEFLLDSERLALVDWNGGGRAPATECRGRVQAAVRTGQDGPEAFFGKGAPMRVRTRVTAGRHMVGVTFLATQYAPLLDLDKHFRRSTIQTGPTPGYTFFPHVGTVRIEGPFGATRATSSPSRRKLFICTPAKPGDEETCARRIIRNVATGAFRRPATAVDVDSLMEFYRQGMRERDFELGVETALARVLASPQFIYRIEQQPPNVAAGQTYRVSDLDLASRLSFFLWSSPPDDVLLKLAEQGRLREPAILEQQVRRMLAHPKANALSVNFAGQWLNLRGLDSLAPVPAIYPDFDDPLREAMRTEVEMLFDSIVRNDRPITELLTADYTFVNERLAAHYGIPNIYGSQFRRITLGPELDIRRGLLGKGAILTTTSKPDRTSPVTRGKWIMTNIFGMSPPDPPPNVPPLPARATDARGNAHEPTMREKMLEHRVRADCVQCHRMMDPIGFALENFDAIGLWRSHDEGTPIDAAAQVFDNTMVDGPVALRQWITAYSGQFVRVSIEKLLTYALGRGLEYQDMPLVRSIARDVAQQDNRFSALVLAVVRSAPFQTNTKTE